MSLRIVPLFGKYQDWERAHKITVLEVNGKAEALDALNELKRTHPEDFKKLIVSMKLVAGAKRVLSEKHVKRDKRDGVVYEMRGGHARLFFFYTPDTDEVVVCTNQYWKTKPSAKEQDAAFEKCRRRRELYIQSMTQWRT